MVGRSREQGRQGGVQLRRDGEECEHAGIVGSSLEPSNDVRMDSREMREGFLAQVPLFAAFPNFLTEAFEDRPCAHAQSSIPTHNTV